MNFKKKNENTEQPSLTPDQLEMLNSRIEQVGDDRSNIEPFDNSAAAKAARYVKKHKTSTVVLGVCAVCLVLVLVFLAIYAIFENGNDTNRSDFKITMGDVSYEEKYEKMVRDGVLYINMLDIAELCDMTYSGAAQTRKFTLKNTQYIKFENDSEYAVIDGNTVNMEAKAYFEDDKCFIPYKFITKAVSSGLSFKLNNEKNSIVVKRIAVGEDKNDKPIYQEVTFSSAGFEVMYNEYEPFDLDVSAVISFIDPTDIDEYLILVNHQNPLGSSYIPKDLTQLTCETNPVNSASYYSLRSTVASALYAMMDAMKSSGINGVQVSSSYRSYERQNQRWQEDITYYMNQGMSKSQAEAAAHKYLAKPGESEHQTGLCVDFVCGTTALTEDFENTAAFEWLSDNAHKFGFILRYPKDKVNETGYGYEPWHYRFVGRTTAYKIYESKLCFEEYIELANYH